MVILCKNPNVRMSLLVTKDIWPLVVGRMQCYDLTYKSEKELKNDDRLIRINDIEGKGADLIGFINNLETFNTPAEDGYVHKIYILMTAKRGKKYVVKKDGEETGGGSEAGTGLRSGPDSEPGGTGDRPAFISTDELRELEVLEADPADDDCDQ